MKQVKQSDNTCTVGWRNIWGRFTLQELQLIKKAVPECGLCSTQYTFMVDVNHPDRLERYMTSKPHLPNDWGYYIDYPQSLHEKIWNVINIWFPLLQA